MPDFRKVNLGSVRWFPQCRNAIPATPIRVQVPPSPCTIGIMPGRYTLELSLVGHAAHPAFLEFLEAVEREARERNPVDLPFHSCLVSDISRPFRLSAFDDARFYDVQGNEHASPPDIKGCHCLIELGGAWVTGAKWGVRWKVLEVKEAAGVSGVPCLFRDQ